MAKSKKPVVFLSHSSGDKLALGYLRAELNKKTGSTVSFFLSSDGQSIPLGRNWVYEIEQALKECELMFVFLSLNSIKSRWILFEAGYAYSRDIRVVPVGCPGMSLDQLTPPLSLLQGFNISNAGGLNNIIAQVNRKFDFEHGEGFNDDDFSYFSNSFDVVSRPFVADIVDDISCELITSHSSPLDLAASILTKTSTRFVPTEGEILTYGLNLQQRYAKPDNTDEKRLLLQLGFERLSTNLPLVFQLAKKIHRTKNPSLTLRITFRDGVVAITKGHKISDMIFGSGMQLNSKETFDFRGIVFRLAQEIFIGAGASSRLGRYYITLQGDETQLNSANVAFLIELLLQRGIVTSEAIGHRSPRDLAI